MATKKVAVVLAGCGVFDGAEIHEATFTLYSIQKLGAEYQIFAPDIMQHHVVNHLTKTPTHEQRNVLVEAARIARGKIAALGEFRAEDFDALIFPGGFGVAKNLSTFAFDGADCSVHPEVEQAILDMVSASKPIGALCIAPVVLARVLDGVRITIGDEAGPAKAIELMGGEHVQTTHGEVVVDTNLKLATTPCYMLDATIVQIAEGAENVVRAVLEMA